MTKRNGRIPATFIIVGIVALAAGPLWGCGGTDSQPVVTHAESVIKPAPVPTPAPTAKPAPSNGTVAKPIAPIETAAKPQSTAGPGAPWKIVELKPSATGDGADTTVALVMLRERIETVGTDVSKTRIKYQDTAVARDFATAAKTLDPNASVQGFALMNIDLKVDGGGYHLSMTWRAIPGAREEDFHAILSSEESESQVAVYVSGPIKEIRRRILAEGEALYRQRPLRLDCRARDEVDHQSIAWQQCWNFK
jgi:hypothetical protein